MSKVEVCQLLNALVRLDVEGVKSLLQNCNIKADYVDEDWGEDLSVYDMDDPDDRLWVEQVVKHKLDFMPIISIPLAWDWLIYNPAGWADNAGFEFQRRNNDIKRLLSDKLNIDWNSVPKTAFPDCIVKSSLWEVYDDLKNEFFDYSWDEMLKNNREIDLQLCISAEGLDYDRVEQLIREGSDPTLDICSGESIIDRIAGRPAHGIMELCHYMDGDDPDTYPTNEAYDGGVWTLIRSAAYEKMYRLLNG